MIVLKSLQENIEIMNIKLGTDRKTVLTCENKMKKLKRLIVFPENISNQFCL